MLNYILKRLLLMIPTLLGIMLISFVIVQFVPGGPVERMIAELQGHGGSATSGFAGGGSDMAGPMQNASSGGDQYRGAQGLDPEFIAELQVMYGFDKPAYERFVTMVWNYLRFDLGESYYRDIGVIELVIEKMPVSISLGLWSTLIIYLISIPLGIRKAVKDGQAFDIWSSAVVMVGYAVPSFMVAIALIVMFAGGRYYDVFPLKGLFSDGSENFSTFELIVDYFWHMTLPIIAMVISGFAGLTMLTKNSFMDEIHKQYVQTAKAKGLSETQVLYGHVFRNAMLLIVAGFPSAFLSIFFTGSLLIEVIFSLDGLGLLSYEAIMDRDYPVVLGTLYVFALMGLVINLVSDLVKVAVDPRISYEALER